ncbi:DUF3800 domain-containing protein [Kutzneria chonburiensis]|uniref:DUF3800 domain-containing protein n=1 Tax=Kutzneria chonburiensis TaxID=1483604 RepID=A0ABV6MVH2_9PSEU|nr:DUF3800 domain-containing protein [Kutzneria chonburiensis]
MRYVARVHFCYIDESGGSESPDRGINSTPVMVILGLIVEAGAVPGLTRDFLALKRRYFPRRFNTGLALDEVLHELKGNEVLQMVRSDSRNRRRQASLIQQALIELVNRHGGKVVGRIWVKRPGKGLKPDATYCYAAQDIAKHFSQYLIERSSTGLLIADGRDPEANSRVAHSIFTQKYRVAGDPYPPVLEVPLFSDSRNHVGIQIADLLASTLVFPMAAVAYGTKCVSVHSSGRYHRVRDDHGEALRELQFRYLDETGRWRGGLVVSDIGCKRTGSLLFSAAP